MKELKCPKCAHVFHVDQEIFESLANQVKTIVFKEEVERRLQELRAHIEAEMDVRRLRDEQKFKEQISRHEHWLSERDAEVASLKERLENEKRSQESDFQSRMLKRETEHTQAIAAKDKEIASLQSAIAQNDSIRRVAILEEQKKVAATIQQKDTEIAELRNRIEAEIKESTIRENSIREQHAVILRQKDETIEYYKDMKTRMSTKMIGETLEIHCQNLFLQAQSMGMFPDAYFGKDNDISTGT